MSKSKNAYQDCRYFHTNGDYLSWLKGHGSVSDDLNTAEFEFLINQGIAVASLNDMWFDFLDRRGIEGDLHDKLHWFWCVDGGDIGTLPAPRVTSSWPINGQQDFPVADALQARFNVGLDPSTVNASTVMVSGVAGSVGYDADLRTVYFVPDVDLPWDSQHTFTLTTGIQNVEGTPMASDHVISFKTERQPLPDLEVTDVQPPDGSVDVPQDASPVLTFNTLVDFGSISPETVYLEESGASVPATLEYDPAGPTITIRPINVLPWESVASVHATTGLKNDDGKPMPVGFVSTFTVESEPVPDPIVLATDPEDGETNAPVDKPVTATFNVPLNPSTVDSGSVMLDEAGVPVSGVVSYVPGETVVSFTPDADLTYSQDYTFTLAGTIENTVGVPMGADHAVSWTTQDEPLPAPEVVETSPIDGAAGVDVNTIVYARFNTIMDESSISSQTVSLSGQGIVGGRVAYDPNTKVVSFSPDNPLDYSQEHTLLITTGVRNAEGLPMQEDFTSAFTTRNPPLPAPEVVSTDPDDGSTDVPVIVSPSAVFNIDLLASSVNASTVLLNGGAIAGTVTYDNPTRTVTFDPDVSLDHETLHTFSLTTGIQNTEGTPMAQQVDVGFTTVKAPLPSPEVTDVDPPDASTSIPVDTSVVATFNTEMNPASINAGTVLLDDGQPVSGSVSYDALSRQATFTPDAPLPYSRMVSFTVTTGVENVEGKAMLAPFESSFTTESSTMADPEVQSIDPPDGSEDASPYEGFTALFNVPLDPGSVSASSVLLDQGGVSVAGSVSYSPADYSVTFTPTDPLDFDALFDVRLTTDIANVDGSPMPADFTSSFTTRGQFAAPQILQHDPEHGAGDVPVDGATFVATWNVPLDGSTLDGNISVEQPNNQPKNISISYDPDALQTTVVCLDVLEYYRTVYVRYYGGIANEDGIGGAGLNVSMITEADPDGLPPEIDYTLPTDGATGVNKDSVITGYFLADRYPDPPTIDSDSYYLEDSQGGRVPWQVSYSAPGRAATGTPDQDLESGETYTATFTSDIKADVSGAPMVPYSWSFTIIESPKVVSSDPEDGETGVSVFPILVAEFNIPLAGQTVNDATVFLSSAEGPAAGSVDYLDNPPRAIFSPDGLLLRLTGYTLTLTTGIQALNGEYMEQDVNISFTTRGNLADPEVIFHRPRGAISAPYYVPYTEDIVVQFNVPMDPDSFVIDSTVLIEPMAMTATLVYDADNNAIIISDALVPDSMTSVTVTSGVRNEDGVPMPQDWQIVFQVTAYEDVSPRVREWLPADQSAGVPIDESPVEALYNTCLNESSIDGNITLTQQTGPGSPRDLPISWAYDAFRQSLKAFPREFLPYMSTIEFRTYGGLRSCDMGFAQDIEQFAQFDTIATGWPSVISTDPDDGAVGIPVIQQITITFDMQLDPATVNENTITAESGGAPIAGTVSIDGSDTVATFAPSADLPYESTIDMTVHKEITRPNGWPMLEDYTFSFATEDAPLGPPSVASTDPDDGATGVVVGVVPLAVFDVNLDPATVTTSTVTLDDGSPVSGTVAYDDATMTTTFTPDANLAYSTVHAFTLGADIANIEGLPMGADHAVSWTTEEAPGVIPVVEDVVPADGATGVPVDTSVTLTFNTPLNPSTVVSGNFILTDDSGTVSTTVSYTPGSVAVTMTPSVTLSGNMPHTVTVTSSVESIDGTPMETEFTSTFTTGASDGAPAFWVDAHDLNLNDGDDVTEWGPLVSILPDNPKYESAGFNGRPSVAMENLTDTSYLRAEGLTLQMDVGHIFLVFDTIAQPSPGKEWGGILCAGEQGKDDYLDPNGFAFAFLDVDTPNDLRFSREGRYSVLTDAASGQRILELRWDTSSSTFMVLIDGVLRDSPSFSEPLLLWYINLGYRNQEDYQRPGSVRVAEMRIYDRPVDGMAIYNELKTKWGM